MCRNINPLQHTLAVLPCTVASIPFRCDNDDDQLTFRNKKKMMNCWSWNFKIFVFVYFCSAVGLPILAFYLWGDPYKRGFFCDDESLKHPFHDSTIRNWMLYIIGIVLPVGLVSYDPRNKSQTFGMKWWICCNGVDWLTVASNHKQLFTYQNMYTAIDIRGFDFIEFRKNDAVNRNRMLRHCTCVYLCIWMDSTKVHCDNPSTRKRNILQQQRDNSNDKQIN